MATPRKPCPLETHPLIAAMDRMLREGVLPRDVWKWVNEQAPDDQVSLSHVEVHWRSHLGLRKTPRKDGSVPTVPPSARLGRDVTEADIDQRLMQRYYDSIDSIPAEKIAELMIEREKAKGRVAAQPKPVAPKVPTEDEVAPEIADMRAAAAAALGPKRGRTGLRAVR